MKEFLLTLLAGILAAVFLAVLLAGCVQTSPCGDPQKADRLEKAHQHE